MLELKERPAWPEYFMQMAELAKQRSTCLRRKVGAVLVKDNHIIATGYNGAPSGIEHCKKCIREKKGIPSGERHELCRGVHAEQNCIIQAARHGVSTKGSALFLTNSPCSVCAKMIINAGITAVYFKEGYPDDMALEMLYEAKVPAFRYRNIWGKE
jgi:dCMP deaminase